MIHFAWETARQPSIDEDENERLEKVVTGPEF